MAVDLIDLVLVAVQDRTPQEALRRAFSLWAVLALLGLMLVLAVAAILASRRRRMAAGKPHPGRKRALKDAWMEAGRRVQPEEFEDPDDDDRPFPPPEERYS